MTGSVTIRLTWAAFRSRVAASTDHCIVYTPLSAWWKNLRRENALVCFPCFACCFTTPRTTFPILLCFLSLHHRAPLHEFHSFQLESSPSPERSFSRCIPQAFILSKFYAFTSGNNEMICTFGAALSIYCPIQYTKRIFTSISTCEPGYFGNVKGICVSNPTPS